MGIIFFIIVSIAGIYWIFSTFQSLSADGVSSRRKAVAIDYLKSSMQAQPSVSTIVEEAPRLERLPQTEPDLVPIMAQIPPVDRSTEVLPNFTPTPSKTEESLLFRTLVLGMFGLSVISMDLAAGTHYGWVGIPFVTMGSVWSWHRRHYAKHWLNLLVSIGSLAIVIGCLVPILVGQMQIAIDRAALSVKMAVTLELALGMLLVSLQMGLSFHLYHRRLLGYCLMTSGMLMGVAAGLSQNIGFFILLCGFIAIGIPALMLDYRSKLAMKPIGIDSFPQPGQLSYQHLPWRYLSQLAAISIGLGLMLSVFLPNFQIRDLSFPRAGVDPLQSLAQKYHSPKIDAQSPATSNPSPPANAREIATKLLGQPGNNNYPDTIKADNLQLSPELASQLQQVTQQILATSPQPLNSDYDRATYLAEYLKQHHQDDPQQLNLTNLPAIDAKLIQQITAKCAAALQTCQLVGNKQDIPVVYTSMLRSIGIPARLKTGDKLAEIDPQTKLYLRPAAQAQSQTEVYFPNWGWFGLDSTPDRPLLNLTARQLAQLQEQLQQIAPSPSATPTPQPSAKSDPSSSMPQSSANSSIDRSPPVTPFDLPKWNPDPAILKTIVIAIAIGGGIAGYLWYQRQQQQQLATLPPIERIYRSMVKSLSKTGSSKLPSQTQLEYARSVRNTEHPQIAKVVEDISQLYTAWRYGKQRIDVNQLTKKLQALQHLQQVAANRKRQQWFAQVKALWTPGNTKH
jgi:transglutaminase-like putative cysteine protease